MNDRVTGSPDADPLEALLRMEGPLPLPVGFAARTMRGLPGLRTIRPGRAWGRLAAAAAVLAAVTLSLADSAPAFAQGIPVERVAEALGRARAEAPALGGIAADVARPRLSALPAAGVGLLLLAAGPLVLRRGRRAARRAP
jgi:hypothetical protein